MLLSEECPLFILSTGLFIPYILAQNLVLYVEPEVLVPDPVHPVATCRDPLVYWVSLAPAPAL